MKICLVGEYSKINWSGSATNKVQKNILKELSKNCEAILYELPINSDYLSKLYSPILRQQTEYGTIISGGIINLFFFLKKEKYDLVHYILTRRFMLYICLMLLISPIKKVTTFHDIIVLKNRKINFEWYLKKILIATSDIIFVYSNYDMEIVTRFTDSPKIFKIKNGVDLSLYFPLSGKENKNIITFAGGLGKSYKGLNFLENSLEQVNEPYELQICGENSRKLDHESYIGELNEREFISQLRKSYIVVVASEYESFSLNGLEAMACGIPLIITKDCGFSEYLHNGTGCFVIEYGDTQALAECISSLVNKPELREKMSGDAQRASEEFSWENVANEYLKIYNELLASH